MSAGLTLPFPDRYSPGMFRLRAPLVRPDDVDALADAGADAFFCGVVDPCDEVEVASSNRRANPEANLHGMEALAEACAKVHARGCTVHVAFNEHHVVPSHLPRFRRRLEQAREAGADGVIVGSLPVLAEARRVFAEGIVAASVAFAVRNAAAARFLRARGVDEIVLSRDVVPVEAARLARACPDVEFEVFAKNSRCGNIDGLCGYSHHCLDGIPYDVGCMEVEDRRAPRLRLHACAACQLHPLRDVSNLRTFKVAGRDFPPEGIVRDVAFVRAVLDRMAAEPDAGAFAEWAMAWHERCYGAPCGRDCYYER